MNGNFHNQFRFSHTLQIVSDHNLFISNQEGYLLEQFDIGDLIHLLTNIHIIFHTSQQTDVIATARI